MASLTMSEKDYWRKELASILKGKIKALLAGKPNFENDVAEECYDRVLSDLDVVGLMNYAVMAENKVKIAEQQLKDAIKALNDTLPPAIRGYNGCSLSHIQQSLKTEAKGLRQSVLAKTELGQQVLDLEAQIPKIDRAIMLATSSANLKGLFLQLAELWGEQISEIEQIAQQLN